MRLAGYAARALGTDFDVVADVRECWEQHCWRFVEEDSFLNELDRRGQQGRASPPLPLQEAAHLLLLLVVVVVIFSW